MPTLSALFDRLVARRYLVLALLGLALYVPFLGSRDFWYPDEPDIAEVAIAMYESGDWIAPRRLGEIWVDYPPMIYWAGTISAHLLGGFSEFALRLPNALGAIALVLLTCAAGTRWAGARIGFTAGFLLLTFQQAVYEAVNYRPDTLFSLMVGAGMFLYAAGAGERPRWWLRVLAFAFFGLSMLAKGPLGLLLPGLVLTLWLGFRREWRRILELAPLALVAMAVYMPWFVACARAMGADSILGELYAQSLERFAGETHRGHGQPFYYYFVQIWADLLWRGPLLPFGIWWVFRTGRLRERNFQLALWWLATWMVFLSIAATKRQLYLLPVYPAAALLLAPWIAAFFRPAEGSSDTEERPPAGPVRIYSKVLAGLYTVIAGIVLTAALGAARLAGPAELSAQDLAMLRDARVWLILAGLIFLGGAVWIWRAGRRNDAPGVLARIGAVSLPMYLVILAGVLPAWNPAKTYKPQCRWIAAELGDETSFGLVNPWKGWNKQGAFKLYSRADPVLLDTNEDIEAFLDDHPRSLVLVHERAVREELVSIEAAREEGRVVRDIQTSRDRYHVVRGR